jgi:hypothetical protein
MTETIRLTLPLVDAAQAQKHVTHNEALALLDAIVHLALAGLDLNAPPAVPTAGQCFLVGSAPTGAFAGHAGEIAAYDETGWRFLKPRAGWRAHVIGDGRIATYDGTHWTYSLAYPGPPETLPKLGIGTNADASNLFALRADNALMTARDISEGGGDLRLKLNKASSARTATVLLQSNWSGRAEMGLAGDDKFRIKVSADGATWRDAILIDPATGKVSFPSGTA